MKVARKPKGKQPAAAAPSAPLTRPSGENVDNVLYGEFGLFYLQNNL